MSVAHTTDPAKQVRRVFLIDGSGYIFRAYHALPPLSRSDGTPVGAVLGFANMLAKLLDESLGPGQASHIGVILDAGRRTFRNDIYPDYKAHRPPAPEDLVPQFPLIREVARAFNVACVEMKGFEADDVIATYAREAHAAGLEVVIISSDKDLMQLVDDGITMFDPMKVRPIGVAEVREKFGVDPDKVVDVQALAGDSTDNVPGVPGVGVKTAAELITTFGDLDTLLARASEIRQPKRRERLLENADEARMSRELVRLRNDVPLPEGVETLARREPDLEALLAFLRAQEFKALIGRIERRMAAAGVAAAPVAPAVALAPEADAEYRPLLGADDVARVLAEAVREGALALALQTDRPDPTRADLVGIALATAAGRAAYLPLGHDGAAEIGADEALALFKPVLEDPSVLKVGHNIKELVVALARRGITAAPLEDTMLLAFVLDAGRARGYGLDDLAEHHLGRRRPPVAEIVGSGKARVPFAEVALDTAVAYAAEGADLIWRLQARLKPRLVEERLVSVYETLERPLIPVLAAMESTGIRVDRAQLAELSEDFAGRAAHLETEICKLAGHPFNVGSPKQLGEVLFDEMGLAGGRKGKTGAYATGADILETLAQQGHDLPARVLDWRQLTKLQNTYTDALQEQIDPNTGRVHTAYDMAGAATGRLASNDPNLQNIPVRTEEGRKIRRAFVAEPGYVFLSADYSQIELRLLAHIADIAPLRQAFRDGLDIHALTASEMFGVPVAGMDAAVRRSAKAINFGIIYGISAFGLARQLGIPRADAAAYIETYFQRYPGIRGYMEATKEFCRGHGYVETIFGRRCHLPGIHDKNPNHRAFSERAAINAPLQGSAADIIKRAMIRMPPALRRAGAGARMLLSVHDELLFEVPEDEVADTAALAKGVMEGAAHLSIPLTVDTGTGANWDEAH